MGLKTEDEKLAAMKALYKRFDDKDRFTVFQYGRSKRNIAVRVLRDKYLILAKAAGLKREPRELYGWEYLLTVIWNWYADGYKQQWGISPEKPKDWYL